MLTCQNYLHNSTVPSSVEAASVVEDLAVEDLEAELDTEEDTGKTCYCPLVACIARRPLLALLFVVVTQYTITSTAHMIESRILSPSRTLS